MDTTVALFFSLGIVMSPNNEPATTPQLDTANTTVIQEMSKPSQKRLKRHELVKKRIAATNAWLANQRQQRRQLAQVHQPQTIQVSFKQNLSSCNASWTIT